MPTFESGDVVRVPFPYTDRSTRQHRPALVIAARDLSKSHGLLWVLMITSAENRAWPSDVPVQDLGGAGLPAASVVRTAKIATIQDGDAQYLGRLSDSDLADVRTKISSALR